MTASFSAYAWCEPWNLLPAGLDATLDYLAGEVGLDGLCVSATAGDVHAFRARADAAPRTFRCPAAAHFQPAARCYADSRLRPATAAWIRSANPLEQIAKACEKRRLKLRVRVVLLHAPPLVDKYPFAACKDAFGDPSPARLCPGNPDVRAYAAGLIEDLTTNYAVEAVDVGEADFGSAAGFHPGRMVAAPVERWAPSVHCFCESCRQAATEAGVDVEAAALAARTALESALVPGEHATTGGGRAAVRGLEAGSAASEHFRQAVVVQLFAAMKRRTRRPIWAVSCDDAQRERGVDWPRVREFVEGCLLTCDGFPAASTAGEAIAALADPFGGNPRVGIVRSLAPEAHCPSANALSTDLVAATTAMALTGHREFIFGDCGIAPPQRLEWVRQAVRFARREASAGNPKQ